MKWLGKYNIGVKDIDNQHRELARILTMLKQSFSKKEDAVKTLIFLAEYTKQHFSDEEKFMQSIGFPDYDKQKQLHKQLASEVMDIIVGLEKGKRIDVSYLTKFLTDWLMNHILDEDKKIGTFYLPKESEEETEPEFSPDKALIEVTEKLKKLNTLVEKELIGQEDFDKKKEALLEGFCSSHTIDANKHVKDCFDALEELKKQGLIADEEAKEQKSSLIEKIDLNNLLNSLPSDDEKLQYLKSLKEEDLITSEVYETHKSKVLDDI